MTSKTPMAIVDSGDKDKRQQGDHETLAASSKQRLTASRQQSLHVQQSPSSLSPAATSKQSCESVSFHLKSGIFTRLITIDSDKMALGLIKQLAIAFLNEIYFQPGQAYPSDSYIGAYLRKHYATSESLNQLYDRIILRLYNPAQDSFVPFYSVGDIQANSFISIEISERNSSGGGGQQQQQVSSVLCDSSDCNPSASASSSHHHHLQHPASPLPASSSNYQLKISHDFHSATYIKPTYCHSCSTLILGVYKQGFQCNHCKKNYCPKCKIKADVSGEACLALISSSGNSSAGTTPSVTASSLLSNLSASNLLSPKQQQAQANQQQSSVSNSSADSGASSSSSSSVSPNSQFNSQQQQQSGSSFYQKPDSGGETKLEISGQHANMSKRKSASNLLHFNIANPFKSHHNQQQAASQEGSAKHREQAPATSPRDEAPPGQQGSRAPSFKAVRGSAGALDPILQQLSKQMQQQQQQQQSKLIPAAAPAASVAKAEQQSQTTSARDKSASTLLNVQTAQLSSSHQNLYTTTATTTTSGGERESISPSASGCSSAHQSPNKLSGLKQLSNSGRHSARDITQGSASPTRRDQVSNHAFMSMDWIQLYGEPTCGVCNKLLRVAQANKQQVSLSMCKTCKLQVHAHCQDLALADCLSRVTESSRAAAEASGQASPSPQPKGSNQQETASPSRDGSKLKSTNSNVSRDNNIRLHRLGLSVKHMKRPDLTKPIIEGWLQHKTLSDEQPRRHYWRLDETDITLYESETSSRYFKAIALTKITRVISASALPKQIKEDVALGNSQVARNNREQQQQQQQTKSANTSPLKTSEFRAQMESMFAFEVATGSVYLVQASDQQEASRWRGSIEAVTAAKKAAAVTATPAGDNKDPKSAEASNQQENKAPGSPMKHQAHLRQFKPQQADVDKANELQKQRDLTQQQQVATATAAAQRQPDQPDQITGQKQPSQVRPSANRAHHQQQQQQQQQASSGLQRGGQQKTYTDPNRSRLYNRPRKVIKLDPMSIPDHWIEGKYLIERNRTKGVGFEELGSGQFGKVYAAVSEIKAEDPTRGLWSGVPVAIKEISKARFDLRQQAKLKNEANILSRLDHPGVIILERVHDLPDKLYIVMEQLEDDMLEMIVSTEEKRLSERVTKFLTYQILEALKYLHSQNIAHCDLKPENVLLCEQRSQFPQIKLCDFGFAKIIEENSFRSSLVGTPAYLAPEVVKGERYNRSVDLWSVGVIVYVSLSGEFPFNEGENIHDQISRANFMYPEQPWAKISAQAKSFINSLLRVNSDKRLSASRAQMDTWLQDYQLWCDLCELELRLGRRWVTDDADFGRWSQYARQRQIQVPRAAIQLHQELASGGAED